MKIDLDRKADDHDFHFLFEHFRKKYKAKFERYGGGSGYSDCCLYLDDKEIFVSLPYPTREYELTLISYKPLDIDCMVHNLASVLGMIDLIINNFNKNGEL